MIDPMTAGNESKLCGKCGARPATIHICNMGKSVDLCEECVRVDESNTAVFAARLADEAKSARCCYCEGSPCGGGADAFLQIAGGLIQIRWMCMSCLAEYCSYAQNALESISRDLPCDEQIIERIKEVGAEADAHMAAFVRCRNY